MRKFLQDIAKFPPYQWGVGTGNSLAVSPTDGSTAKIFKRAVFNIAAPIATVFSGYQLALASVALLTFPFVAAPVMTLGAAAYGIVMGVIFTPWIAGISQNGMKENIAFLKSPLKASAKSYGGSYERRDSKPVVKNGLVAKFKAALGLGKKPPSVSVPVINTTPRLK